MTAVSLSALISPKSIMHVPVLRDKDLGMITQLCDVSYRRVAWYQSLLFFEFGFFFSSPEILKEGWVKRLELRAW